MELRGLPNPGMGTLIAVPPYVFYYGKGRSGGWEAGVIKVWKAPDGGDPIKTLAARDYGHDFFMTAFVPIGGTVHAVGKGRYTDASGRTTYPPFDIDLGLEVAVTTGNVDLTAVTNLLQQILALLGNWQPGDNVEARTRAIQFFLATHRMNTEPGLQAEQAGFPPGS